MTAIISNPFVDFTFRCSSLGKIVTDSGKITKGVETYLTEVYYAHTKGYYKDINSKYFEKGNFCEQAGIDLLQKTIFHFLKVPIIKNTERLYNKWIEGEHDVKVGKVVVDIKNCWDWITLENAEMTHDYECQLRGYMWLNDCDEAILFYCLLTPPEHMLIEMEKKMFYTRKEWLSPDDPTFMAACNKLREMYNFDQYPPEERFRAFYIKRDLKKEEQIKKAVEMCRNRLFQMHLERQTLIIENRKLMGIEPQVNNS